MNITPDANDLWEGIGGHFDSFSQILCEFIDNSISNFDAHKCSQRTIRICINAPHKKKVKVIIEDTGTGIKNYEPVLRLGDRSVRESPLNEHGFGLKHALASANPSNDSWEIYTRTSKDIKKAVYKVVSAPFIYNISPKENKKVQWPGMYNGAGTLIEFECSELLFNTTQRGIRGKANFERCLDYLREDLGYIYAGTIHQGKAQINIQDNKGYSETVHAVTPDWAGYYKPGSGDTNIDLGAGKVKVAYTFGEVNESTHVKHYKKNMSTSGVEIRINGRLLMSNLLKEIWDIENHPSYNHFSVIIDLKSDDRDKLPKTRTSKNGIRSGDDKLEKLFDWIKKTHPNPYKDPSGAVSEKELVKDLADLKDKHIRDITKHIEPEFKVFRNIKSMVSLDLYVYDGKDVVLYEAKKDQADVQNVYQLLMYWDGAVSDGLEPTEGILLASSFSKGVNGIINQFNKMTDQYGNKYNFSKKTWLQEGIKYPKP